MSWAGCLLLADCVAKVFLRHATQILRAIGGSAAASRCNQVIAFQRRYCRCRHCWSWRCGFARALASAVGCSQSDPGSGGSAKHFASRSDATHWDATGKRQATDRRSAIAYSFAGTAGYSRPSADDDCPRNQGRTAATRRWRVTAAASKRQAARRGSAGAHSFADTAAFRPSAEDCPRHQSRTAAARIGRTTSAVGHRQATRRGPTIAYPFADAAGCCWPSVTASVL
jgi:hypothetical protein